MEKEGVEADKAYQQAVEKYRRSRQREELAHRVAQEQFMETATVPPSQLIEEMVMEERQVMEQAGRSQKD